MSFSLHLSSHARQFTKCNKHYFYPLFWKYFIKDPTLQEKGIKENYIGQNFYRRLRCLIVLSEEVDFRFFLFVEFLPQVTTKLKKDGSVSQMQYSY